MTAIATAPAVDPSFRFLQDIAKDLATRDISFPTFSQATMHIRNVLDDPNVNADKIARVVTKEPLLAAKLVKLANTAALNPSGRAVSDVRTAVIRVGHSNVRSVAAAVAYEQLRGDKDMRPFRTQAESAWKHTVQVAALSHVIASKMTRLSADEALFAGLVHDIGYYYLLSRAGRYAELHGQPEALGAILREWHASIGQTVLHSFGLTQAVLDAVGEHESGTYNMPPEKISDVVALANLVASASNPVNDPSMPPIVLDEPELMAVIGEGSEHVNSLAAVLQG